MKKILLAAIIFLSAFYSLGAQDKPTAKQQLVQKTVIDMFQALSDRDADKLRYNCTADVLVLESGIVWNLDTLIQIVGQLKTIADFKCMNTFDFIDTKVNKNMAYTTYYNYADITRNGKHGFVKWIETAVLIKDNKAWKIKVLHSTVIKRGSL